MAVTSSLTVSFEASSVSLARHAVAEDLDRRGLSPRSVQDAVLILSELLSNALKHAHPLPSGRVSVTWSLQGRDLELTVTDGGGPTRPVATPASRSATGGRGLAIVRTLARDWGVLTDSGRTTVWATVDAEAVPARR